MQGASPGWFRCGQTLPEQSLTFIDFENAQDTQLPGTLCTMVVDLSASVAGWLCDLQSAGGIDAG